MNIALTITSKEIIKNLDVRVFIIHIMTTAA
jgi:hypothetical protein